MLLLQDHREKHGHHNEIERYCQKNDIEIKRVRLNVGDYMFPNGEISVDTKQSLLELASDLYRDKQALNKKYKKCLQDGIKLVVLVQEPIKSIDELVRWKSQHCKIRGGYLLKLMETVRLSYSVEFVFCSKRNVGKTIIALLNGEILSVGGVLTKNDNLFVLK